MLPQKQNRLFSLIKTKSSEIILMHGDDKTLLLNGKTANDPAVSSYDKW
jgi:hypothetical protein